MRSDLGTFLAWALRAQRGRGPHAELAPRVVLAVLAAQLLAGSQHERPPHAARRASPAPGASGSRTRSRWPAAGRAADPRGVP